MDRVTDIKVPVTAAMDPGNVIAMQRDRSAHGSGKFSVTSPCRRRSDDRATRRGRRIAR